jgi:cytochrome P450
MNPSNANNQPPKPIAWVRSGRPPGPGPLRGLRALIGVQAGDLVTFEKLFAKYGDLVMLRSPLGDVIVLVFHPDDVEQVIQLRNRVYAKGTRYGELGRLLGNGLVNSEGELWHQQRRKVTDLFTPRHVEKWIPLISRNVERIVSGWCASGASEERDIKHDIAAIAFGVAAEAFLAMQLDDGLVAQIQKSLEYGGAVVVRRIFAAWRMPLSWPTFTHRRFRREMRGIDNAMEAIIDRARSGQVTDDHFLARLIASADPTSPADRRQLCDELKTIMLVGHETSSAAIAWSLDLVARNPQVQDKLARELDAILHGNDPTRESLAQLPYLRQVVQECMRLRPAIPLFPRSPVVDDELRGCRIPAHSTMVLVPWVTHRHPEFWPDPEAFRPERFERFAESKAGQHPCAYYPFGYGPRRCLGEYMALLEAEIALAKVFQRFRLRALDGFRPRGRGNISLQSTNGIRLRIERRDARTLQPVFG